VKGTTPTRKQTSSRHPLCSSRTAGRQRPQSRSSCPLHRMRPNTASSGCRRARRTTTSRPAQSGRTLASSISMAPPSISIAYNSSIPQLSQRRGVHSITSRAIGQDTCVIDTDRAALYIDRVRRAGLLENSTTIQICVNLCTPMDSSCVPLGESHYEEHFRWLLTAIQSLAGIAGPKSLPLCS